MVLFSAKVCSCNCEVLGELSGYKRLMLKTAEHVVYFVSCKTQTIHVEESHALTVYQVIYTLAL